MHATCNKSKKPTSAATPGPAQRSSIAVGDVFTYNSMCYVKLQCALETCKCWGVSRRWARVMPPYRINQRINYAAMPQNTGSGGSRPRRSQLGLGCGGSRYRTEIEVTHPLHVLAHRSFRTIRIARRNRVRYRLMVLLQRARFKSDRIRKSAVD